MSLLTKRSGKTILKLWVFCGVFLPLTVKLGFWQLQRAEEKQSMLELSIKEQEQDARLWRRNESGNDQFRPYRLQGRYLGVVLLLDNRTRDGNVGYEVYTPFLHDQQDLLLVNRGWVSAKPYRHQLPDITLPELETTLEGYFYKSSLISGSSQSEVFEPLQMVRVQTLNVESTDWWKTLLKGLNLARVDEFRLSDDAQTGALKTDWPTHPMNPEKHRAYAFQWFSLALALLLLTIFATHKIHSADGVSDLGKTSP